VYQPGAATSSCSAARLQAGPAASITGGMSNHDKIVRSLGVQILAGDLPVGGNLPPEPRLLERFGVSRTALREAIKTLSAKGLLVAKTRVGTRVADRAQWNYFDPDVLAWRVEAGVDAEFRRNLAEVRLALEPTAAALAAERRTPEDLAAMTRALERMGAETGSPVGFARADLELHLAVGAASRNPMIRSMAAVIQAALMEAFTISPPVQRPGLHAETVAAHARIVDCIAARDADGAAAAMRAVIQSGVDRMAREARGARAASPTSPR